MREKHFHTIEILVLGYAGALIGLNVSRIVGLKLARAKNPVVQKLARGWVAANTFGSSA